MGFLDIQNPVSNGMQGDRVFSNNTCSKEGRSFECQEIAESMLIATNGVYKAILPAKSMLLLVSQKRKVHGMYVQVCN